MISLSFVCLLGSLDQTIRLSRQAEGRESQVLRLTFDHEYKETNL